MYKVDLVIFGLELDFEKVGDLTVEDIKYQLGLRGKEHPCGEKFEELKILAVEEEDLDTGEIKVYKI